MFFGLAGIVDFSVRLYPDPDNKFFFNFKPYVTALINTRNFEDTLATSLQSPSPASFIYDFTAGTFLQKTVRLSITLSNNSLDQADTVFNWLAGAEQLSDYTTLAKNDFFVMSPFKKEGINKSYLKYWQGYPFDIPFYFPGSRLYLKNQANLLTQSFAITGTTAVGMNGPVSRLFVSDGRTDETLEDLFPLSEGFNSIRIKETSLDSPKDKILTLEKVPYKCGVYLKWLNKYGAYNYWLFEDTFSIDRTTKQLGELDRDNANVENTFGRAIQIGKESQDTMKIIAELLTEDESRIVEGILDSPKVYLFTGQPFSIAFPNSWIEVVLKTASARIKNPKQKLTNFSFDIELPQRYTQTL